MNMKFDELSNLINEGIGEDAAEKFKETFAGDTAPEFISFRYKNQEGEIADRVVNIGIRYQQMLDKNDEKLKKAESNIEELKNELRPILQKKAESTGGLFNNQPVDSGYKRVSCCWYWICLKVYNHDPRQMIPR